MDNNIKIKINQLECNKCGHKWMPRQEVVIGCPKCKNGYYKGRIAKKLKQGSGG